jgi:hypothetical protein
MRRRTTQTELRECDRNYESDRCVDFGSNVIYGALQLMSQQDGSTSENQRTEMLDSLFSLPLNWHRDGEVSPIP